MKVDAGQGMVIEIIPYTKAHPPGKLADATLHFVDGSPLEGLSLIGFAIWTAREQPGKKNLAVPAKQFLSNGEKRSMNLLRLTRQQGENEEGSAYYRPLNDLRAMFLRAYERTVAAAAKDAPTHAPQQQEETDQSPDVSSDDIPF